MRAVRRTWGYSSSVAHSLSPALSSRFFSETAHKDALAFAQDNGAEMVDFRFCDLYGVWQHFQMHIANLNEKALKEGFGFDGSSFRGWQTIEQSDMLVIPDPTTTAMDPFTQHPTVTFLCDIWDPITKVRYHKDPRNVATKAVEYLKSTGIASDCKIGPETEFFVFDKIGFGQAPNTGFYEIDSIEAEWGAGIPFTGHYKNRPKGGYFPEKPSDSLQDLRTEMVLEMVKQGVHVEASHHEIAGPGQCEIDILFGSLRDTADQVMTYKYCAKNVAARHDKIATFMPKPIADDNGSGMHTHVSLSDSSGRNLFSGDGYCNMSQMGLYFIGGLIKHAQAVCAFTNPTINSYKRLVPGFEAPVNMAYSGRNRSAAIRIPVSHPSAARIEFRTPDPTANPYLAFSAILMAGLDGIQNKIHPGDPTDKDLYSLEKEEIDKIVKAPTSLREAMDALETDNEFLLRGDVFSKDLVDTW
eukprot:CAMPEP_0174259658 /NCGR_PEP_ID=MMETSP0439-20130205/8461_1 /TAXON_ID=0 /ORGANISM="Stereomyxa ramosa, Strain Chinc5" /LENGTH=469 /DNA_ID=CAMNT_0015343641 /DNA_START=33 /DNA_END=1439 /DNA_ORIENTATION=-